MGQEVSIFATVTLIVLAVDALDAGLVDHYELESLELTSHTRMETYANMQESPYTPEVWATVATGLAPDEHHVTGAGISEWDNPLVDIASRFTGNLPLPVRKRLGVFASKTTGADYAVGRTDQPTFFDGPGRVVHNWPGVANGEELADLWRVLAESDELTLDEFQRRIYAFGAQQFAWAEEMLRHNVSLAGVHIHTADALGHAFAEDEERLEEVYEWIARWVTRIERKLGERDELLVLSDHGMVVSFYSDDGDHGNDVAGHSWRAFASSTTDSVPTSVFEVKDWVEAHVEDVEDTSGGVDLPEEQLRQLGYIE